jgi:hypothetical protein
MTGSSRCSNYHQNIVSRKIFSSALTPAVKAKAKAKAKAKVKAKAKAKAKAVVHPQLRVLETLVQQLNLQKQSRLFYFYLHHN